MSKKLKEEGLVKRVERLENYLLRDLTDTIQTKFTLQDESIYANVMCGKCGSNLGSWNPTVSIEPVAFYNQFCPKCGNKTVFESAEIERFKPIIEDRMKSKVKLDEKNREIERLEKSLNAKRRHRVDKDES